MSDLGLAFCGLVGLLIGSFLNVVIARVPERESIVHPGSHCPKCGTPLAGRDLIPVLSWVLLRGRCRTCRASISARYPLVELATGALFVAAALRFGAAWDLPAFCVFLGSLLALSMIDLDRFILPNRIVYPTLFICAPLLALAAAATGGWGNLERAAIGGGSAFGFLLIVHLISPRGMGFGDVRLAGVIGMMLGWLGMGEVVLGLFAGFLLASVVGVGLIVTHVRGRKDAEPFGPFLAAGATVAVLFGPSLLSAYGH